MARRIKTLVLAGAAALALTGSAQAGVQTLVFRSQPITLKPFEVVQPTQIADSPKLDGYVVGMDADVVDGKGAVLPLNRVMLHHVVFAKLGVPDSTCAGRSPIPAERFYATGEERTKVQLPAGYGYPNLGSNLWGMLAMLMNHHNKRETVYVRYTVRYETGAPLVPVKPIWLDEHNCSADPVFDVPGTGAPGSTFSKRTDFPMLEPGRLVEGVGHLHGGGIRLDLSDRTCARRVFSSLPTWGGLEPKPVTARYRPRQSRASSTRPPPAPPPAPRARAPRQEHVGGRLPLRSTTRLDPAWHQVPLALRRRGRAQRHTGQRPGRLLLALDDARDVLLPLPPAGRVQAFLLAASDPDDAEDPRPVAQHRAATIRLDAGGSPGSRALARAG